MRPQIRGSFLIDNQDRPFIPKLKSKPNSERPLAAEPDLAGGQFSHPYEYELQQFEPPPQFLDVISAVVPKPLQVTDLVLVDSEIILKRMIDDMMNQSEIAVDVEHHSKRSYLGLTCLIQISTREVDYVVDPFAVWEKLESLNAVFTNPNVMKVFHGAQSDVQWLQRDFGVYIINMFDTYCAARLLKMERFSLAYLLNYYLDITVDKQYQLADWRIRPLPAKMLAYAREDTHYLLYVCDRMRIELGREGLMKESFEKSKLVCLLRYEKPAANAMKVIRKWNKNLDNQQLSAFKDLHKLRDAIARKHDESPNFILPNDEMIRIAERLPTGQRLLSCCKKERTMLKLNQPEIEKIIVKARGNDGLTDRKALGPIHGGAELVKGRRKKKPKRKTAAVTLESRNKSLTDRKALQPIHGEVELVKGRRKKKPKRKTAAVPESRNKSKEERDIGDMRHELNSFFLQWRQKIDAKRERVQPEAEVQPEETPLKKS